MSNKMKEDWIECDLGEICFTTSGGTPSRNKIEFYQGSIPWVKSGELDKGIIYDTEEHISEEAIKNSSAKIFPEGTLLIALYGATIGKLAFLGVEAATNQAICGIFKSIAIEPKYLFNFLLNRRQKLISQGTGGAQPNISQTILKNLSVPLAPLPIQRAIVSKIEALFSDLDNGIANFKKAQEQLKVYRQAVLKKAFEGKLSELGKEGLKNDRMMDDANEEILQSNNPKNHNSDNKEDNLPKGWKWVKSGEIMTNINSGSTPKAEFLSASGEIQFLKVYNLNFDGTLNQQKDPAYTTYEIHSTTNKRAICIAGDVLINIVGPPLGKVSVIPENSKVEFNINQAIVRFRPNEKIQSKYLSYFLQNPVTINWLEGTSKATAGQYNVKVTTCREILIPLPPTIEEQTQIVQEIESRLSVCDKMEQSINESIEKAEALRQSILKKAFEGKLLSEAEIQQCKQAADYEPASELLTRIERSRNEKIQAEKVKTRLIASQQKKKGGKNGK